MSPQPLPHVLPTLRGARVAVRAPDLEDLDAIRALWADPETMAPVGGPHVYDRARIHAWWRSVVAPGQPGRRYGVIARRDGEGEVVGEVSFRGWDAASKEAHFNIKVHARARGGGFGLEAGVLMLAYFFGPYGGTRMVDDLAATNAEGRAFVERLGFEHEPSRDREGVCVMVLTRDAFCARWGAPSAHLEHAAEADVETVRTGYDRVSQAYRADQDPQAQAHYAPWLRALDTLPDGAPVLDLGCGCGEPVARLLAERLDVLGVDLSPVQVERARALVPGARFVCADMRDLRLPPHQLSAVIALYALIHVPLVDQPRLLRRIGRWLKPWGYLIATVGSTAWTGVERDWLGVPGGDMAWSHADEATYLAWMERAGLDVVEVGFVPEGSSGHTRIVAQRSAR